MYHTGGGETATVLNEGENEKSGIFEALSDAGYIIASATSGPAHWGSPVALRANDVLFRAIRSRFGVSQVAILCQSMGGLSAYSWASRNPQSVLGIYGLYPVTDLGSMLRGELGEKILQVYKSQGVDLSKDLESYNPIDRLSPIVASGIVAKHRHGEEDRLVEYGPNAREFAEVFRDLGGSFELVPVPGLGHEANPRFFDSQEVLDFMEGLRWDRSG